ncbi:uncharacterized protein LOC118436620 [Folsomia candida]|nr:uncharacterized protein LOC118436620 [Folsomia candida]
MSDCRRCTKIRGDSWYPVLRFDESDDTLTTVKWTKEEETEGRGRNDHHGDGSCFTTRCNSDRGKSRVGESSGLKKCSSSETTKICITNRAESTDLCLNRGGGDALLFSDTDNDMLLSPSPPIHYCNCNYCSMEEDEEDSEVDLYSNDEGRKENDQDHDYLTPRRSKKKNPLNVSQKMSSKASSFQFAGGDCCCSTDNESRKTGNDAAILFLEPVDVDESKNSKKSDLCLLT